MYIMLSYVIDRNTPMYGGKTGFISKNASSTSDGDSANTSYWKLPNHLGTHVDFPRHFYGNGQTIEDFPLDFWFFQGKKIQLLEVNLDEGEFLIKPDHIKTVDCNQDAKLILLKTDFGQFRERDKYWEFNPGLSIEFVKWLKSTFPNIRMFGLDSISISSWQNRNVGREVHKLMLNPDNPIILIEDMDLSSLSHNTLFNMLWVSPWLIKGSDGCPCTVLTDVR